MAIFRVRRGVDRSLNALELANVPACEHVEAYSLRVAPREVDRTHVGVHNRSAALVEPIQYTRVVHGGERRIELRVRRQHLIEHFVDSLL